MVNGCIAGLRTLFWAIVFLGFFIYCLGVLLQQVASESEQNWCQDGLDVDKCTASQAHLERYREQLFGSVGRAMTTVFRCYTDGCSSVDGTPLIVHIWNAYGPFAVGCYVLCSLFVIFGIFNLVAAIFVENTIEFAKRDDEKRRAHRRAEKSRVARTLQQLLGLLTSNQDDVVSASLRTHAEQHRLQHGRFSWLSALRKALTLRRSNGKTDQSGDLARSAIFAFSSARVTRSAFDSIMATPEAQALLEDLDISLAEKDNLFVVLDSDNTGSLGVSELVQGLLKLRGGVLKSDLVESLLAVRALQKSVHTMEGTTLQHSKIICEMMNSLQSLQESFDALLPEA